MQLNVTTNYIQQMPIFTAAAQILALVQHQMANWSAKISYGILCFKWLHKVGFSRSD